MPLSLIITPVLHNLPDVACQSIGWVPCWGREGALQQRCKIWAFIPNRALLNQILEAVTLFYQQAQVQQLLVTIMLPLFSLSFCTLPSRQLLLQHCWSPEFIKQSDSFILISFYFLEYCTTVLRNNTVKIHLEIKVDMDIHFLGTLQISPSHLCFMMFLPNFSFKSPFPRLLNTTFQNLNVGP